MVNAVAPYLPSPESLVSTWRRFGEFGPAYRIDAIEHVLDTGETVYRVSVPGPRDGEVLARRYSEVLADPEAS
jgi:hypothetical protein